MGVRKVPDVDNPLLAIGSPTPVPELATAHLLPASLVTSGLPRLARKTDGVEQQHVVEFLHQGLRGSRWMAVNALPP